MVDKYKPPEEEAPEDTAEKPPERHFPSLSDYTKEDLWNMHPEDLKALLDDFRNKAVMNPTHENVTEYYRVQDVVRRKALAFAAVSAEVMEKYPDLDVGGAYSNAIPGNLAMVRTQNREIEDTIRSARDDFALLYFYQPNCEFCVAQDKILKFFMEKYGWQVRKINRYENGALAGTLDVDLVPTLLMIERDEPRHVAVARGVVALNELEANLYRGIRFLRGNVGPEEYPMFDYQKGGPFDVHAAPDWNTKK